MDKTKTIKELRKLLTAYYSAYVQASRTINRDDLIEQALETAATKAVYQEIVSGKYDEILTDVISGLEEPLEVLCTEWAKDMGSVDASKLEHILDKLSALHQGIPTSDVQDEHAPSESTNQHMDIRGLFTQKVSKNYASYFGEWLKLTPTHLIERAETIAATRKTYDALLCIDDEKMEYLMRFANPLEVVRNQYMDDIDPEVHPSLEDDVENAVNNIMDKQDAEQDYELDPDYAEKREEQGQAMH